MSSKSEITPTTTLAVSPQEVVRAALVAHQRTSKVFAEPAATQAAGEAIRLLLVKMLLNGITDA